MWGRKYEVLDRNDGASVLATFICEAHNRFGFAHLAAHNLSLSYVVDKETVYIAANDDYDVLRGYAELTSDYRETARDASSIVQELDQKNQPVSANTLRDLAIETIALCSSIASGRGASRDFLQGNIGCPTDLETPPDQVLKSMRAINAGHEAPPQPGTETRKSAPSSSPVGEIRYALQ